MALMHTPICDFDTPAPAFILPGTDGQEYDLERLRGPKGLLIMFICNHCPYVKAIRTKLVRDANELMAMGVGVAAINANDGDKYPEDSFPNMCREVEQFDYRFPYLWDENQTVAHAYGAVCTPDFFGYNRHLKLQYRGRLDDAGATPNANDRPRELFDAMQQIAATDSGPIEQVASMGCSIKWKPHFQ